MKYIFKIPRILVIWPSTFRGKIVENCFNPLFTKHAKISELSSYKTKKRKRKYFYTINSVLWWYNWRRNRKQKIEGAMLPLIGFGFPYTASNNVFKAFNGPFESITQQRNENDIKFWPQNHTPLSQTPSMLQYPSLAGHFECRRKSLRPLCIFLYTPTSSRSDS